MQKITSQALSIHNSDALFPSSEYLSHNCRGGRPLNSPQKSELCTITPCTVGGVWRQINEVGANLILPWSEEMD